MAQPRAKQVHFISLHFSSILLNLLDLELSAGMCRCLRQDARPYEVFLDVCFPSFKLQEVWARYIATWISAYRQQQLGE